MIAYNLDWPKGAQFIYSLIGEWKKLGEIF
jgi:hypothetical protein